MDFCIRAMSQVEPIRADARVDVQTLLGKRIEFRSVFSYEITLPIDTAQFEQIPNSDKLFAALDGWARVFVRPDGNDELICVVAPAEDDEGKLCFYNIELRVARKARKGPREYARVTGAGVLSYDECASWLIELAQTWKRDKAQSHLHFVIRKPANQTRHIRIAWVIPPSIGGQPIKDRLASIGEVYGAEIVHVEPRSFRDTEARLKKSVPYEAAVICTHFAPHITADAVPESIDRDRVLLCESTTLHQLEEQIRTWIEVAVEDAESRRFETRQDEGTYLLALMLRAMISHSKIGESSHCPKETVLKVIRGRRMYHLRNGYWIRDASNTSITRIRRASFSGKNTTTGDNIFLIRRRWRTSNRTLG